jgi:hypothetical protein
MSVREQTGPAAQLPMLSQSNFTGQAGTWTSFAEAWNPAAKAAAAACSATGR